MGASRHVFAAVVVTATTGCCGDDVRGVDIGFSPEFVIWPSYAWLGDTVTVYASAVRAPSLICMPELYNSFAAPERFRFSSSDPAVATITGRGVFTARALGVARLTTVSEGYSAELSVIVSRAFATLHITVTPETAH